MTTPTTCSNNLSRLSAAVLVVALAIVYILGSYAALKTNITLDTEQEQNTLRVNINAVAGLLQGDPSAYRTLQTYGDKYYGIGFHALAYPVQKLLYKPIARALSVDGETAFLLAKHWLVFNLFFASALLLLHLTRRLTDDEEFSRLVALGYLLWPFLLGHAMFNVKDIPFLFAWMLCTWLSLSIMESFSKGQRLGRLAMLMLGICTGWLISIRISGGLILFQFAVTLACAWPPAGMRREATLDLAKRHLPIFLVSSAAVVMISYPVFWANPLKIFAAIDFMSHHPMGKMGVCSLVYGSCHPVANLPWYYLPAWLSAKLPEMIIAGYLLLPLALWNNARTGAAGNGIGRRFMLALSITSLLIPVLLAVRHTILYHDLRQVLFLMPLYFIAGAFSLYWLSRQFAMVCLVMMICIFVSDNLMSFPYQYIWFNEVARQFKVGRAFETDYWGSSAENSYARLRRIYQESPPPNCLYADDEVLLRFVQPQLFNCIKSTTTLTASSPRPFLILAPSTDKFPAGCSVVAEEKLHLLMGNGDISLRTISYCK